MYVVNLYRPQNGNLERLYKMISELFTSIEDLDKTTLIIGGDFNIDFGKPNSKGAVIMKKLAKRFSLEKQVNKSTRPLYGEAVLDQIFTNSRIVKQAGIIDGNISNHVPVFIVLKKDKLNFEKTTFTCRIYI